MSKQIIVTFFLIVHVGICNAALMIDSQSITVDMENEEVLFSIAFNRIPDFYTVDEFGRTADSFQYFIDFDSKPIWQGANFAETVIRGSEIYAYDQIPFRDEVGDSSDPTSGGWGEIRALVPYQLDGTLLTFTATFEEIGDFDGQFSYALYWGEHGGTNGLLYAVVPEPTTLLLLGLGGLVLRRRRSGGV